MSHNWLCRLAGVALVLLGAMALPQSGSAALEIFQQIGTNSSCGSPTGFTGGVLSVNREGKAEEGSDIAIESEAGGDFAVGHQINVTITNGRDLTAPVVASGGNLPLANLVVCDGAGGALAITQPVVNRSITVLGVQVTISFQVTAANTNGEAIVALRNLRWDVTEGADGSAISATAINCTNPPSCTTTTAIPLAADETVTGGLGFINLGALHNTIASSFVDSGFGLQNANGGLLFQADFGFAENFLGALRMAEPASPPLHPGDIATTATSVEMKIGSAGAPIPTGVSVTMPGQFEVDPLDGALLLGSPSGTCSGTGTNIDCTYQTLASDTDADDMAFTTANGTQISTGASAAANTIVVTIGSSSGSGIVPLDVTFGPDATANPSAIPRYIHGVGCSAPGEADECFEGQEGVEGRGIIHTEDFFEIVPTKTDIIVPWVTNLSGFNAGISVSNTGLDDFGSFFCPAPPCTLSNQAAGVSNTGPVTVTLFPDDGTAPIVFTTGPGHTPGRGLAANGTLAPGSTWAVDLTTLLAAAGVATPKEGYMTIQTGFTLGHAAVFVFTPSFGFAGTPVIVLPTNFCRGSVFDLCSPFALGEPQGQVAARQGKH